MVPAPSAATVAVVVVGVIVTLVGYILLRRRKNGNGIGTNHGVGGSTEHIVDASDQVKTEGVYAPRPQHSQRPDQKPRLETKTLQEVATSLGCGWQKLAVELNVKLGQVQIIEKNHQNDIIRQGLEMLVTWKQAQSTSDEQQITTLCTALENIGRADIAGFLNGIGGSRGNIGTVSGSRYSSPPDAAAATGQRDIATSSHSIPIPSAQAPDSCQDTGATGTNHGVDDSNKPTFDGSGQVKSAAATGQGDNATSSPNAKSTSPSSTPIPSAQASDSRQDTGATGTNHGVDDSNEPIVDDSESPHVQIRMHVMDNDGQENVSLTRELWNAVDDTLQCAGPVMIGLTDFFTSNCGLRVERIEQGSVTFVVRIMSREGLNKLWSMYTTGELAKKLTEIVITEELTTEDKSDLAIQATIQESDYEQASRFFDELEEDQQKAATGQGDVATSSPDAKAN